MTPPLIFDRLLLRTRRQRGLGLGPATFLLDQVADEFAHRLRLVLRRFELAVDLGTPTAAVRTALLRGGAIGAMIAVDPMIGSGQCSTGVRLSLDDAANSSPPPCGEGSGVGVGRFGTSVLRGTTPHPIPPPQGGRESKRPPLVNPTLPRVLGWVGRGPIIGSSAIMVPMASSRRSVVRTAAVGVPISTASSNRRSTRRSR